MAHRGRLAQEDRDPDPVSAADGREQPLLHDAPELLDLGGDRELLLVEDRRVVHVPVVEFDRRIAEPQPLRRRGDEVVEARRRILDRDQDLRALDPEMGDLGGNPFQLVERRSRLPAGAPLREELPGVELDGVHRGVVLLAVRGVQVGQANGRLVEGAGQPGLVASGDRERRLLAERLRDHPDESLAGSEIGNREIREQRVLAGGANDHQGRRGGRLVNVAGGGRHREVHSGRLEAQPRGERDRAARVFGGHRQPRVQPVRDAVAVRIAQQSRRLIEDAEGEVVLGAGAGPARHGSGLRRWRVVVDRRLRLPAIVRSDHAQRGKAVEPQVVTGRLHRGGDSVRGVGVGSGDPHLGGGQRVRPGFHLHPHRVGGPGGVSDSAHDGGLDVAEGVAVRPEHVGRPGGEPRGGGREAGVVAPADRDDHGVAGRVQLDGAPAGGEVTHTAQPEPGQRLVAHGDLHLRIGGKREVERQGLESEPGGEVRRDRDLGRGGGAGQHDPGVQPVGNPVPVRVGNGSAQRVERGERLRLRGRRGGGQHGGKTQNNGGSTHRTVSFLNGQRGTAHCRGWVRAGGTRPGSGFREAGAVPESPDGQIGKVPLRFDFSTLDAEVRRNGSGLRLGVCLGNVVSTETVEAPG